MYNEKKFIPRPIDLESMIISTTALEPLSVCMTGESIDRIYKKDVLVDEIHSHNLVVNSFLNLIMCLMKREEGFTGMKYWAIGSGLPAWDSVTVNPSLTETRLTNEIGRVELESDCFSFLDSTYEPTDIPSNILQVRKVFMEDECNGTWREFGIFGGNATTGANSGIMIDKKHHGVITKTNEIKVERIMRFVLNLV